MAIILQWFATREHRHTKAPFGHLGPRLRWKVGSFLQMLNVFLLNFDRRYGDLSSARYNKVSYHELDQCIIT